MISPTSMASPPAPVTSSAWMAARRLFACSALWPTSRNDSTVVTSQKTKSNSMLSLVTSPNMAPAKPTISAANTPRRGSSSSK